VNLAFVGDPTDVDRVRQDLVDVPTAEQSPPGRAAPTIDADWKPNSVSVELLLKAHDAPRLEIATKQRPHDLGTIFDDVQRAIFDPVAQRDYAPQLHPLPFRGGDLVPDALARNLPLKLGEGQQHIESQPSHAGRRGPST
jgi:hypothetical protein